MNPAHIKAVQNASIVCGNVNGLAQGISWLRPDDVTEESLARIAGILNDNHQKMKQVVEFLLSLSEGAA
jgi:hypothetical protein